MKTTTAPWSTTPTTKRAAALLLPTTLLLALALLALARAPTAQANAPCSLPFQHRKGSATDPAKGPYVSHTAPLASFRQPRESLDRLKGFARGVKGHVGTALGGVKQRWADRRAARREAKEGEAAAAAEGKGGKKKVGGFDVGGWGCWRVIHWPAGRTDGRHVRTYIHPYPYMIRIRQPGRRRALPPRVGRQEHQRP